MTEPFDVYLMAFACEPGRGSEPGVGFAFARAAARAGRERGRRTVLVTRPHRVAAIRDALGDDAAHLEILSVALPAVVVALTGRRRPRPAYVLWQLLAVRRVRAAIATRGVPAVVHHVTFATEALPTFERLAGATALVFGPSGSAAVEGGGPVLRLRRIVRHLFVGSNLRHAAVLVAQNSHVGRDWSRFGGTVVVEPNIVVEADEAYRPPERWVAASAGYLEARKRVDLAIEAFAAATTEGRLAVVGDGPEMPRLRTIAARAGVTDRVDFLGALPRDAVLDVMRCSRVLLHTSRQEGAGWVVGEAQSVGTLPIVLAGSGSDTVVAEAGVGVVVEANDPEALRDAIVAALNAPRPSPSNRWSAERLPDLLDRWWRCALRAQPQRVP